MADNFRALMDQMMLLYIRDQTKTRVEQLIEEEAGR
jgi:hypothetical protein